MVHIYLCEDEAVQLRFYEQAIREWIRENTLEAEVISARQNPEDTLRDAAEDSGVALFLVDVELKGYAMDGFALCRELKARKREYYFVFLTSKSELAYKAFEYELDVLDYIVKKPEYFLEKQAAKELEARFLGVFRKLEKGSERSGGTLRIECGSRSVEIDRETILCVQSLKGTHQVEIITNTRRIQTRQTMEKMKEILGDAFIFINKSCLIAKGKITEMDRKNRFVVMENGARYEVAFRKAGEIWKYIEEKEAGGK